MLSKSKEEWFNILKTEKEETNRQTQIKEEMKNRIQVLEKEMVKEKEEKKKFLDLVLS